MASSTREIVTFQLGHYSNFIGTHWWNIQESSFVYDPSEAKYPKELNHDILFREGRNPRREVTYTPRLIALDLKGSLNTLKQEGVLYDVEGVEDDVKWFGDITLHKTDPGPKNEFLQDLERKGKSDEDLETSVTEKETDKDDTSSAASSLLYGSVYNDLDNTVNVWSDFLRIHLHPKSVAIVEQYKHGWENKPFDVFGYGQEVYNNYDTRQGFEDRIHFFLEECDNLQGMNFLVDTQDGFGGLASSMVEELSDDYSNKSIVIYSLSPSCFPDDTIPKQCHRAVNSLLSYDQLISHSSMFVPLSLASTLWRQPGAPREWQHMKYNNNLHYHTSSILAACLDTMTIPYRLESPRTLMSHFTDGMTSLGRKVLALQAALPVPLQNGGYFVDYLHELGDIPPWQSITPGCSNNTAPFHQSVVIRGIPNNRVKRPVASTQPDSLNKCATIQDIIQLYLTEVFSTKLNSINSIYQPLITTSPFPHIINRSYLWPENSSSWANVENVLHEKSSGNFVVGQNDPRISVSKQDDESEAMLITDDGKKKRKLSISEATKSLSLSKSEAGYLAQDYRPSCILSKSEATEVPLMTALQCGPDIKNHIDSLVNVCKRFNIGKFHRYTEGGLEEDMYTEAMENLIKLSVSYGKSDDSDSDDDSD